MGFPPTIRRSRCGAWTFSSRYTWKLKRTSSASSGCPSEKRRPCRSLSVYRKPSGDTFQDFARADSVSCVARLICTRSACMTLITSREGASVAKIGFNVFGSARNETTSRPPDLPISPGTTRNSPRASCWGVAASANCPAAQAATDAASRRKSQRRKATFLCIHAPTRHSYTLGSYLGRVRPFLQRARKAQVAEEERHHCRRRQVHPPVGRQNAVLLQVCEQIAPARDGFGHAESQKRQSYFGENILRHEDCGLREDNARGLRQNVFAQEVSPRRPEAPCRADEVALLC